ncbi:hypothetical protein BDN70DRAFT_935512 [Pholiota conissans]|uniref:Uncharacterized protein n=1 Tax=Pholiota conissans TaxID=109636 RepID=A0A9P5YWI6_9AGAR|nr:hypothetical protein BDN70DRAFT_935512 [Pholiota conissans]
MSIRIDAMFPPPMHLSTIPALYRPAIPRPSSFPTYVLYPPPSIRLSTPIHPSSTPSSQPSSALRSRPSLNSSLNRNPIALNVAHFHSPPLHRSSLELELIYPVHA